MTNKAILEVVVPQLGVNDLNAKLEEWLVDENEMITKGDLLCVLETTKATFELAAEASGYLVYLINEGTSVEVNTRIALIGDNLDYIKQQKVNFVQGYLKKEMNLGSPKATKKAVELALHLGIEIDTIKIDGHIIREKDVQQFYEKKASSVSSKSIQKISELIWDENRVPVIIYGASKGALTIRECIEVQQKHQVVCFIDDDPTHKIELCELTVFHSSKLPEIANQGIRNVALGIAGGAIRLAKLSYCKEFGFEMINVIHPNSYIAPSVKMGKGNYIKAGAIIETNTVIKDACIIDNGVIIAHDNVIENGCHLAPGVVMGSSIHIGELSILGIGVSVSTNIKIGRSCIVSVGSSITKDVEDFSIIEGVPGKKVGTRNR